MKNKVLVTLVIVLAFCFCGKDNGNDSDDADFTLNGTVYLDDVPVENVMVEFGTKPTIYHPTWSELTRYTDKNGKYSFKERTGSAGSYGAMYRVRVKSPLDGFWTEYKSGSIPLGQTVTEDFKLYTQ